MKNGTPLTPNRKPTTIKYADGREVRSNDPRLADELRCAAMGEMTALEALKTGGAVAVRVGRQRNWTDIDNAIFLSRIYGNGLHGSMLRKMESGDYTEIVAR